MGARKIIWIMVTWFLGFYVLLLVLGCKKKRGSQEDRPNIILILVDDMGWSDVGAYGGEIETPHIDHLAENGVRFTQFYNTSKCFPSRACLLTGLYAQQTGYHDSFRGPLKNAVTLGEALSEAGYRTLWAGKHHGVESPVTRGFDRYYGLRDGACNHFNPGPQRPDEPVPAQKRPDRVWYVDSVRHQPYSPPQEDFYTTDVFTNYALQWLDEYQGEKKPYFLYLAYTAPHDPLMAWPADIAKYRGKYRTGYEKIRAERFRRQKEMGLVGDNYRLSAPDHPAWESLTPEEKDEEDLKMAVYAAMIDRVDQNIARILMKVEDQGELENTVILFMSDNGGSAEVVNIDGNGQIGTVGQWTSLGGDWSNVSNTPLRYYKNYSHEGGIRTPLIVSWPKAIKDKNRITHFTGHFIDLMPTLLDIAGATYPEQYDGKSILPSEGVSLLPILKGGEIELDRTLFWQWSRGRAVRKGKWKIVAWRTNGAWQLYDMDSDPAENFDLAEQHPEIVAELNNEFEHWLEKTTAERGE